MRDAKQLTEFTLTDKLGTQFKIVDTYLTSSGQVYIKLKDIVRNTFVNYYIADFNSFLKKADLTISVEPTSQPIHLR